MDESKSKEENAEKERRFDPELLKKGLRRDLDQYEMLKRCSDKKDMTEWNDWRRKNPTINVCLSGANFRGFFLSRANFKSANLERAWFWRATLKGAVFQRANANEADFEEADLEEANISVANLQECRFCYATLKSTKIVASFLNGANFTYANLTGCQIRACVTDSATNFRKVEVNKFSTSCNYTDFSDTPLGSVRVDPGTRQLLEYNIRRMNWEDWYKKGPWWRRILKRLFIWPFWLISDYGLKTWRIIITFFVLAFLFALIYWLCPSCVMVNGEVGQIRGFWHALYFSVVTMTTLGFGDIAANPDSWWGQTLLMIQVILGYVLLGALVTRFAVLFTAGGPAGEFAKDKKEAAEKSE